MAQVPPRLEAMHEDGWQAATAYRHARNGVIHDCLTVIFPDLLIDGVPARWSHPALEEHWWAWHPDLGVRVGGIIGVAIAARDRVTARIASLEENDSD